MTNKLNFQKLSRRNFVARRGTQDRGVINIRAHGPRVIIKDMTYPVIIDEAKRIVEELKQVTLNEVERSFVDQIAEQTARFGYSCRISGRQINWLRRIRSARLGS